MKNRDNWMELKDRVRPQGEYNVHVYICLDCNLNINTETDNTTVDYALGWFQVKGEWVYVWECPKCGAKWYHHDRQLEAYRHFKLKEKIKKEEDYEGNINI